MNGGDKGKGERHKNFCVRVKKFFKVKKLNFWRKL
jgi:hypothetical protein